jgi:hypothetical protein
VPAPDGWTKTFTEPRLCAAIIDRLAFGGNIIENGTDSYCLATTRARTEQQSLGRRQCGNLTRQTGHVSGSR